MILADLVVGGRMRKVLVHFDKNGFAVPARPRTGELLVAEPFANVTWAKASTARPACRSSIRQTTGVRAAT